MTISNFEQTLRGAPPLDQPARISWRTEPDRSAARRCFDATPYRTRATQVGALRVLGSKPYVIIGNPDSGEGRKLRIKLKRPDWILLQMLATHEGSVVLRDRVILQLQIHKHHSANEGRKTNTYLRQCIYRLREAIGKKAILRTKRGYVLIAENVTLRHRK